MIIRTAVIFFILTSLSELADDTYSSPLYGAGLFSFYTKIVTHYMAKNNTAGALNANRGRRVIPRRPRDLFCSVQERDDVKFSSRRRRVKWVGPHFKRTLSVTFLPRTLFPQSCYNSLVSLYLFALLCRKVTICALVQTSSGEKCVGSVPVVTFLPTAQRTAP